MVLKVAFGWQGKAVFQFIIVCACVFFFTYRTGFEVTRKHWFLLVGWKGTVLSWFGRVMGTSIAERTDDGVVGDDKRPSVAVASRVLESEAAEVNSTNDSDCGIDAEHSRKRQKIDVSKDANFDFATKVKRLSDLVASKRDSKKHSYYTELLGSWPDDGFYDEGGVKKLLELELNNWEKAVADDVSDGMTLMCEYSFIFCFAFSVQTADENLWRAIANAGRIDDLDKFDHARLAKLTEGLSVCSLRKELLSELLSVPYGKLRWTELAVSTLVFDAWRC